MCQLFEEGGNRSAFESMKNNDSTVNTTHRFYENWSVKYQIPSFFMKGDIHNICQHGLLSIFRKAQFLCNAGKLLSRFLADTERTLSKYIAIICSSQNLLKVYFVKEILD